MEKKFYILFIVLFSLMLTSCHFKHSEVKLDDETETYPVTVIADTIRTVLTDGTTLYPVSDDFLHAFLAKAQDYQGHKVTAKVKLPEEWGVRCVERLPGGLEMWLVQSKSREWMYLVVTSGYGTQRILDLIPIAVNLAVQTKDRLETEKWTTVRQSDGAFVVTKDYEWINSMSKATKQAYKANPEKFHRQTSYTDKYYVNEMGRFDYSSVNDSTPDYNAVVFFYNKNSKPDRWDATIPQLQAFCEENNIYFEEVYQGFENVMIHDFTLNEITTVNIDTLIGYTPSGMVMLKKGEPAKTISFGGYDYMQIALKRFFKIIPNQTQQPTEVSTNTKKS